MLNELVDYIEVYHVEKIDGVHAQKLIITRDFLEMVKWLDWLRGNGAKLVTADGVTYEAEPIVVTALLNGLDL